MSKKMLMTLVTASLMFCCSGLSTELTASRATGAERESTGRAVANATEVEVTFEGLMVLHEEAGRHYEVGILIPQVAHHHTFRIEKDKKPVKLYPYLRDKSWILEVTRPSGGTTGTGTVLRERGHNGRLQDSPTGQWDFSWAVDLESGEFHGHPLTLKKGNLKPIIHLPDGELYTKYKSPMVRRKQGNGKLSDFGFVAETTALTVHLQQGEELVLRVANTTGAQGVVFTMAYDGRSHEVAIHNSPGKPSHKSHFKLYYELFSNVPDAEKYDFDLREPRKDPFNEYPEVKWVRDLPCGLVLLGQRKTALE